VASSFDGASAPEHRVQSGEQIERT
jgi:hypothetical protein